jgi:hypothetical protein
MSGEAVPDRAAPSGEPSAEHEVERIAAELVGVLGAGWSWPSIVDRFPVGHPAREHWLKAARTLHARGLRATPAEPGASPPEALVEKWAALATSGDGRHPEAAETLSRCASELKGALAARSPAEPGASPPAGEDGCNVRPDGECVSDTPCIHSPSVAQALQRAHEEYFDTDDGTPAVPTPYWQFLAGAALRATPAEPGASPPEGALADAIMPAYRFCEHIAKEFALDLEGWTWELFGTRDPEKLRDKLRVILPAYAWKYRADYEDVAGDAPREDALRKYGTHLSGCRLTNGGDRCTCGFETALRGPVSPSPGENIICPERRQFPCIGHPGTRAASEGEA